MSAESNEATIRAFYAAWNAHQVEQAAAFIAPVFVDHAVPLEYAYGREGFVKAREIGARALTEVAIQIDDLLTAEAGCVVAFVTITATQIGAYKGIPFTGEPHHITWQAISVMRLERGKLVEHWECADIVPVLPQIHAEIVVPSRMEHAV